MKQLTCEMCGSTDLMKQNGVFVCQSCGCKYSVEDAKKMMIEGTVEVQGTIKVDNTDFVQKYLANARRAKQKEDWAETEKYYNMVEQNDPNNIEAIFYSAYGKARSSLVEEDIYKRQAVFKVLVNCISILDDKFDIARREENEIAICNIATDLGKMICSDFVFTQWKNGYGVVTRTNKAATYDLFGMLLGAYRETIFNIQKIDDQSYLHEASIELYSVAQRTGIGNWDTLMADWIYEENIALERIKKKGIESYWNEHKEEKEQLDAEKNSLNAQIAEINNTINSLPEVQKLYELQTRFAELVNQKKAISLFKGKDRKFVQQEIDILSQEQFETMEAQKNASLPYIQEINACNARIAEIDKELTKER